MKRTENQYTIQNDTAILKVIGNKYPEGIDFIIDKEKVEKCKLYQWHVNFSKGKIYCATNTTDGNQLCLHKIIMDSYDSYTDHINGNTLDNRVANLRVCSPKQNAQNTRVSRSSIGITGVRRDTRCKNSYRAQLFFSSNQHIERTFRDKELAIIQRLLWEMMYFGEFAPNIDLITVKYPYILNYSKVKSHMVFSSDIETVKEIGDKLLEDYHCPCSIRKNENTICPCIACRNVSKCHCSLFVPIQEDKNPLRTKYPNIYAEWLININKGNRNDKI